MIGNARDLVYFQEVAQTGNLTRAAERLGISQPSLSLAIQRLESAMGIPLLIRSKNGVRLTKAGDKFVNHGRHILQEWENLRTAILEDEHEVQGQFSIGAHPSIALYMLPEFIPTILLDNPNLEIKLYHNLSLKITEQVVDFKLDFGIVVDPARHPDLTIIKLRVDEVRMWRARNFTRLQEPAGEQTVLICDPDMPQTMAMLKKARRSKILGTYRLVSSINLEVITELTVSGAGIGIIPTRDVMKNHPNDLEPVPGTPIHNYSVFLAYRRDVNSSKAAQYIKDMIIRTVSQA